jgi:hypothetical protein
MRLLLIATLAAVALPAVSAPAAAPRTFAIKEYVDGEPALGVDARGGAVTTFGAFAQLAGGKPNEMVESVFASVRRPRGGFAKPVRIARADRAVREHALAVGAGGDAAVLWRSDRPGEPLYVNTMRRDAPFGAAVSIPGSRGGQQPAIAIDARGRLLATWLAPGSPTRCGMEVHAVIVSPGGTFAHPRRLSTSCAHAGYVRAALARDGDGVVAWRFAGPRSATSRSSIQVSTYSNRRFHAARTASTAIGVAETLALAAGRHRAVVAWRDHGPPGQPRANRVLEASIDGTQISRPVVLETTPNTLVQDVIASMSSRDGAIVAWQRADDGSSVWDAFARGVIAIRPSSGAPFGVSDAVGESVEAASDPGLTAVALDPSGTALAGYGSFVRRHPAAGPWGKAVQLRYRREDRDPANPAGTAIKLGVSDRGEAIAAWIVQYADGDGSSFLRAAVIPASRS